MKDGQIDPRLARSSAEKVWEGILKGWGNTKQANYGTPEQRVLINLRYNVHVAEVFKNHQFGRQLVRAMIDDNGKRRSFAAFKREALLLSNKYNKQWLEAEYNTALATSRMASKWQGFERRFKENGDRGYLRYLTQRDDRVRKQHLALEGTTLPVDDPFWSTYYPPNGWRCRCFITWAGIDANMVPPKQLEEIPEAFKNNAGKTGQVFTDDNPLFTVDGEFTEAAEKLFGYKPPVDPVKFARNLEQYEQLIENKNYSLKYTDNLSGGFVFVHKQAHKVGLSENLSAAKKLSTQLGDGVIIRDHVPTGRKNQEYEINGVISDLKTSQRKTTSSFHNLFKDAVERQQLTSLVINVPEGYSVDLVTDGLRRGFRNRPEIKTVRLLYNGKASVIEYSDYEKGLIADLIKESLK